MENIKLSSRDKPGYHHRSIGNLHVLLLIHRQRLTLNIGTNASPLLDLVTFSCLFIGNHSHRQLPCRPVTVAPSADLYFIDPWVRVQKRCQHMVARRHCSPWPGRSGAVERAWGSVEASSSCYRPNTLKSK